MMKRTLTTIIWSLAALTAVAQTTVVFPLKQMTGTAHRRELTVTSLDGVRKVGTNLVYPVPMTVTAQGGQFRTNLFTGNYRLTMQGVPGYSDAFVPDTNVVVYWNDLVPATPSALTLSQYYTKSQVDAAIAAASFGSNGGAAVTVSGVLTATTNGGVVTITAPNVTSNARPVTVSGALTATTNGGVVTIRTAGVVTNFSNGMSGGESEVWTMIPKTLFIYPGAMTNDGLAVRVENYGQSAALYSAGVLSNMEEVGRFSFNDDGIMSWLHNFDGAHIAAGTITTNLFDEIAYTNLMSGGAGGSGDATLAGDNTWTGTNIFNEEIQGLAFTIFTNGLGAFAGGLEAPTVYSPSYVNTPIVTNAEGGSVIVEGVTFNDGGMDASNLVVQGSSTFETLNVGELNVTNIYGNGAGLMNIPQAGIVGQDVFNIMAYGATPDDETVDGLAIQSAIDAAVTNGGGIVYMPSGVFLLGTNVVYPTLTTEGLKSLLCIRSNNIFFVGAGMGLTVLRAAPIAGATTASCFGAGAATATDGEDRYCTNLMFSDFTLDGNYPTSSNFVDAIEIYNSELVRFRNVEFKNIQADGIDTAPHGVNGLLEVSGCRFENLDSAIHPGPHREALVSNCDIVDCGGTNLSGNLNPIFELTGTLAGTFSQITITLNSPSRGGIIRADSGFHRFRNFTIKLGTNVPQFTNIVINAATVVFDGMLVDKAGGTDNTYPVIHGASCNITINNSRFFGRRAATLASCTANLNNNLFENGTPNVTVNGGSILFRGNKMSPSSTGLYIDGACTGIFSENILTQTIMAYPNASAALQFVNNRISNVLYLYGTNSVLSGNFVTDLRIYGSKNQLSANHIQQLRFGSESATNNLVQNNGIESWNWTGTTGNTNSAITNKSVLQNNRNPTNFWSAIDGT